MARMDNANKAPVRKLKSGKWQVRYYYYDAKGQKREYKRSFNKKKAASEFLAACIRQEVAKKSGALTLSDVVALYHDDVLRFDGSVRVKESTVWGDETYYRNHIEADLGAVLVQNLTAEHVRQWQRHMAAKKQKNGSPYSTSTINHAHNVLSKYLSYALSLDLIQVNVARNVKRYRRPDVIQEPAEAEYNFWEPAQFDKFMAVVDDEYWRLVFDFLWQTGLREGELFGLTWQNVNLNKYEIYIVQSITSKTYDSGYKITTPKNERSKRTVKISKLLTSRLRDFKQQKAKLDGFNNQYFVFGDITPLSRSTLARYLDYYIGKAGVKRITPHGFRHSHASLLIDREAMRDDVIARRLGHTERELHETYAHIYSRRDKEEAAALNSLF